MQNIQLYYDNVGEVVFDNYGKEYPIKIASGNWKYVNFNNKKVTIDKLERRFLINNFEDVIARYAIEWNRTYPCFAIEYFIFRKEKKVKVSLQEFRKNRK